MLFKFSSIFILGPNPIRAVQKAGWTVSAAETKVGSTFEEIISKILLVFVLSESHKVIYSTYGKGNGDSSKSRIFLPPLQFPSQILPRVAHKRAGYSALSP